MDNLFGVSVLKSAVVNLLSFRIVTGKDTTTESAFKSEPEFDAMPDFMRMLKDKAWGIVSIYTPEAYRDKLAGAEYEKKTGFVLDTDTKFLDLQMNVEILPVVMQGRSLVVETQVCFRDETARSPRLWSVWWDIRKKRLDYYEITEA